MAKEIWAAISAKGELAYHNEDKDEVTRVIKNSRGEYKLKRVVCVDDIDFNQKAMNERGRYTLSEQVLYILALYSGRKIFWSLDPNLHGWQECSPYHQFNFSDYHYKVEPVG